MEIKNTFQVLISRLDLNEKTISKFEDISIETFKIKNRK